MNYFRNTKSARSLSSGRFVAAWDLTHNFAAPASLCFQNAAAILCFLGSTDRLAFPGLLAVHAESEWLAPPPATPEQALAARHRTRLYLVRTAGER
jgi:hypothetical protein